MSDRLTIADALADGKRAFNWRRQIFRTVALAVFLYAYNQFANPATNNRTRVILALVTLPVLIGSCIEWGTYERKVDEFSREVMRDANGITFRIMFHVLWLFVLLDVGFGLPIATHLPWGLPPISIDWRDSAILILMIWSLAFIFNLRWRRRR